MMNLYRQDASNAFKAALQVFGMTWERKTKPWKKSQPTQRGILCC